MQRIAKFDKVSWEQFMKDYTKSFPQLQGLQEIYHALQLPKRATQGSAGYDFYSPIDIVLQQGETIKLPTGIRAYIKEGWVLQLFPRSSLGFTYRLQFDNTVGIIDADYVQSDNEGHIFAKLTNDSKDGKTLRLQQGSAILQGIFLPFGICEDDESNGIRNGGFGSTDV